MSAAGGSAIRELRATAERAGAARRRSEWRAVGTLDLGIGLVTMRRIARRSGGRNRDELIRAISTLGLLRAVFNQLRGATCGQRLEGG